jgi:small nuclear ribonucleoprotein (snRNP)-like protein
VYNKQKELAIPKKKFTFAKKSKNVEHKAAKEVVVAKVDEKYLSDGNHMRVKGLTGQEVIGELKDYEGKENLLIEDIEGCTIKIPFVVKSVYIKNIKNSKLVISAVMGATFIDYAVSTEIYLASH